MIKKFFIIFLLALFLRLIGLNWDQNQHLHPDERFMTMVTSSIKIPTNIFNYFSQKESVLNPYNNGYNFYVYGTFPLLITRFFGELFQMTGYDEIFIIGRLLSVFFDCLTMVMVYKITFLILNNKKTGLWSMFFYGISVFPVQQSHFFTVDAFTVFFSTTTVYFFINFIKNKKLFFILLSGLFFGFTLANKTSIGITLPVYLLFIFIVYIKEFIKNNNFAKLFKNIFICYFLFGIGSLIMFRIFQPYAFDGPCQISKHFISNITEAHKMITGDIDYPPNIQWAYTKPLIHPFINLFLWGLGPVSTVLSIVGIFLFSRKKKGKSLFLILFLALISATIFIYQGLQLAKYMRYIYPIYPFLCIFAGFCFNYFYDQKDKSSPKKIILSIIIIGASLPVFCFISIYLHPHSRVTASEWIYSNISSGSTLTSEEWDDGLPLGISGKNKSYKSLSLAIYSPESLEKWEKISQQISEADYIILSSNRLYGSIPKMPTRYPVSSLFYQLLFSEKLGFKKVAEFKSRPCFPPFGDSRLFCLNDDNAEESFTVYDHPVVKIYQKTDFTPDLFKPLLNKNLINSAVYINPNKTN